MSNFKKIYLRDSFNASALLFSSGSIIQGFLAWFGIDSILTGYYSFAVTAAQVAAMLVFSGFADRVKNCRRTVSLFMLQYVWFFLALLTLCLLPGVSSNAAFAVIISFGIFQNVFIGMRSALDYKLPYLIIDMKHYARLNAVSGFCSGICCVAVNLVFSFFLSRGDYKTVSLCGFAAAALFMLAAAAANSRLKLNAAAIVPERKKSSVSLFQILVSRSFVLLTLPNLIRGICMGAVGMAAVIWLNDIDPSPSSTALLVTVSTAASIASSLFYTFLSRRLPQNLICFLGSAAMLLFLPQMMLGGKRPVFIIFYFLACSGMTLVNYAVPCRISEVVPYEMIAGYSALRLSITMGGSALANLLVGYLIGNVPSVFILCAAGMLQFISGLVFFLYRPDRPQKM